ncbi:MAG TPA: Dyp-type peroxidase [Chloroflexia bacterium]|nr:Dyp-type peroxidase [Chloroflexia bacterium]
MNKINRRKALKALGVASATALGGGAVLAGTNLIEQASTDQAKAVQPPLSSLLPFEGVHQPGIITTQPEAVLWAALDVTVSSRGELTLLLKLLSQHIRDLMGGQLHTLDPKAVNFPPAETGELGFDNLSQGNLSITLGLGASLFINEGADRFGLANRKPVALKQMPRNFAGDRLDSSFVDGDLFLQICSDHPLINLHTLRDLLRTTKGQLIARWVQPGFQRFFAQPEAGKANARGLLGFKDGTANLDIKDETLMSELVWTGPEEPEWARGGTYLVARKIHEQLERWDRLNLSQQEASIGRTKREGVALGYSRESDKPIYTDVASGNVVPDNAHIRKANPRLGEESDKRRMLRRGYLYFNGLDKNGLMDGGFLFMAFCRNVEEQFEYVKRNYMINRNFPRYNTGAQDLDEYLFCVGGGYFFVPPGVKSTDRFLADTLLLG